MHSTILFINIYIEFIDLINIYSSPKEMKELLKNMTFTSSGFEHNHKGGDFMLEDKTKKQIGCTERSNIS